MIEGHWGFITFIVLSTLIAVLCHRKITNFILSCIIAGIIAVVIYQLLSTLILGYLDPFFFVALPRLLVTGIVLAVFVGIPFIYTRRNAKDK